MKKLLFSGLIFCGLFAMAAQTSAQDLFAYTENNNTILRWTASSEKFVDHYIIERGTDSTHFTELHQVVSKGPVTDNEENSYQDIDTYPPDAVNFYRVKTVLSGGDAFYSPAVKVDLNTAERPVLNPSVIHMGGTLHVDNYHSNKPLTINIFDSRGTMVGTYIVNGTSFNINTDRFAKGILFYRISDESHPLIDAGKLMVL
jgi:hypothetical protein